EGEIVGVARVVGVRRGGEPRQPPIEAKGDGVRQGRRGGCPLRQVGFQPKGGLGWREAGLPQKATGWRMAAESGEQAGDAARVTRRLEKGSDPAETDRGKEIREVRPQHAVAV